jgi:hypothetical protein
MSRWPSSPGSGLQNRAEWCNSITGLHFPGISVERYTPVFQTGIQGAIPWCLTISFSPVEPGVPAETSHGRSSGLDAAFSALGSLSERSLRVRRLLREQEQAGALPAALTILRDPNTGAGQALTGLTAAVQLRLAGRDRDWVASIAAMQRSLKPQSTGQHRGDPPFHAGVAQQRQQQFRKLPGDSPLGSASLPAGPISCSRSSNYQSGRLRTARLQVRFLPGVPFCRVSPTTRDAPLRTERLGVEIPHAAPFRPRSPMQRPRT